MSDGNYMWVKNSEIGFSHTSDHVQTSESKETMPFTIWEIRQATGRKKRGTSFLIPRFSMIG